MPVVLAALEEPGQRELVERGGAQVAVLARVASGSRNRGGTTAQPSRSAGLSVFDTDPQ